MKLWILRHGEAQAQAETDAQRRLTAHGRAQVLDSAEALREQPLQAVLVSPYVRAQQTAALVRETLELGEPLLTVPWLTPDASPADVVAGLSTLPYETVLLVSHQPLVGALVSWLEAGHLQQPAPMGTASLACLEGEWLLAGTMTLRTLRHVG